MLLLKIDGSASANCVSSYVKIRLAVWAGDMIIEMEITNAR